MKRGLLLSFVLGAATLAVSSCEDKALVDKLSAQRAEIERLKTEAANLKEEMGPKPEGNPTADLKKSEDQLQMIKDEIESLQLQKEELQDQRDQIAKDFAAYKRKYSVSE